MTSRLALAPVSLLVLICAALFAACGESAEDPGAGEQARNTATSTEEVVEMQQWESAPEMNLESGVDYQARLVTNKGDILIDLFEADAPVTVNSFVFLANEGFYENVPFHRVVSGFVIQSGDPTGTGRGGPGYRFNDEPVTRDYTQGTVAMANSGPNTNGSQFFITLADLTGRLPKNYTIFGQVTEGQEVVDAIAAVPVERGPSGEESSPTEPVFIENVEIITS